jgi:AraC family transcriptional regulator, L-rhamnose operon regulatory protein RhaS
MSFKERDDFFSNVAIPSIYRISYEKDNRVLPELLMLGEARYKKAATQRLRAHSHLNCYEIFHIVRGKLKWWAERDVHALGTGDVYVTRPGEVHGSVGSVLQPCHYFWIQLAFEKGDRLPGMDHADSRSIRRTLDSLPDRKFKGSLELRPLYERLLAEAGANKPFRSPTLRGTLHVLLSEIMRTCQKSANEPSSLSHSILKATRHIRQNLEHPPKVGELARMLDLSPSHFRRRFLTETGFTPAQYVTRERIESAKQMMQANPAWSVTQISAEAGFSSSQYFATVFRRMEGLSPQEFRNQNDQGRG